MRKVYSQEEVARLLTQEYCRSLSIPYSKTNVGFHYLPDKNGMHVLDRVEVELAEVEAK